MKTGRKISLLVSVILMWSVCLFAQSKSVSHSISETEALKIYHEANIAYQKLDYEKSIKLFNSLLDHNYRSVEIYFNLGNAYFKAGDFSKAILNYERAKKIEPEDEDTNFNLKIASLKVVDKVDQAPQIFYKRWMTGLAESLPSNIWTILFIILVWLFFIALSLYVIGRTVTSKKVAFFSLLLFLIVTVSTGVLMLKSHVLTNVDKQAIIMSSSVYIKSSPDEKGNDLFILHEGTKAEVLDQIGDWSKIRIGNGSVGWLKTTEMTEI
jgi:tetratricopeptide (TPR) repeat protein